MAGKSTKWWPDDVKPGERFHGVYQAITHIRNTQRYRRQFDRLHLMLYSDLRYVGLFGAGTPAFSGGWDEFGGLGALSENVIRSIIDARLIKLTKDLPKPTFITDGGSWEAQQDALEKDQFMQGLFYRNHADALRIESARHKLTVGTGAIAIHDGDELPDYEIAPSWEVWVDNIEARYGDPRTFYRVRAVDREHMIAMYPKHEEAIEASDSATSSSFMDFDLVGMTDVQSDMIPVIEAWRLPNKTITPEVMKDEKARRKLAGHHVICLKSGDVKKQSGADLLDEPWYDDSPSIAFCGERTRNAGFWGQGITEDLVGQQLELNRALRAEQETLEYNGAGFWKLNRNAKIVDAQMNNMIGRIVETNGQPGDLEFVAPVTVTPDSVGHRQYVKQSMFENARTSQLTASAQKPAGLNSGKALRTYADIEDLGMLDDIRALERQTVSLVWRSVESMKRIARRGRDTPRFRTYAIGIETMTEAEWSLSDNPFVIKVVPTSALSTDIAGRFEDLEDLRNLGIVSDPDDLAELSRIPDIQKYLQRKLAAKMLCRKIVEQKILRLGKPPEIHPTWPLKMLLQVAADSLLEAEAKDKAAPPESHMDMLRTFMDEIVTQLQALQQQAAQAQQQAQMQAQMQAQALGGGGAPSQLAPAPAMAQSMPSGATA